MPTARLKSLKRTTVEPTWSITLTVPVVVKSEANLRTHWAKRYRRFREQARAVRTVWWWAGIDCVRGPARITLTRLGGRSMDSDNLASSFKAVRDEVARLIQTDDGDPRLTWVYAQEAGRLAGVRITIEGDG